MARVRGLVAETLEEHDIPGMAVAVGWRDRLVFAEGFGATAPDGEIQVTADTRFRLASVTKPITAVAALRLAEAGKLALDDPVREHCSAYPRKRHDPTIRHLLDHQSGIRHPTDEEDTTITGAFPRLAEAIGPIVDEELEFRPGTDVEYSSWGYAVLGCAIEQASGKSYFGAVRELVLEPAGMSSTIADRPDLEGQDFSPGWREAWFGMKPAEVVDTRFKVPASGLVSTAPDLVRFANALNRGGLLSGPWLEKLFEVQTTADGEETRHTLGWVHGDSAGFTTYYHTGSMEGTTALLLLAPEAGYSVAILANRERYARELVPLLRAINDLILQPAT